MYLNQVFLVVTIAAFAAAGVVSFVRWHRRKESSRVRIRLVNFLGSGGYNPIPLSMFEAFFEGRPVTLKVDGESSYYEGIVPLLPCEASLSSAGTLGDDLVLGWGLRLEDSCRGGRRQWSFGRFAPGIPNVQALEGAC